MDQLTVMPSMSSRKRCIELLDRLSLKGRDEFKGLENKFLNLAFDEAAKVDSIAQIIDTTKQRVKVEIDEVRPKLEYLESLESELRQISQQKEFCEQVKVADTFRERLAKVSRLKRFKEFVDGLTDIMALFQRINAELPHNPQKVLNDYVKLYKMDFKKGREASNLYPEELKFLSDYHEKLKVEVTNVIREKSEEELLKSLAEKKWPRSKYESESIKEFKGSDVELWFSILLKIDHLENRKKILTIYKILLREIITEFEYHFCSERATNRLDKPEWAFEWMLKFIQTQLPFFQIFLQQVHEKCSYGNIDAVNQMVLVLLEAFEKKIAMDRTALLKSPKLLIKYVKESVNFESSLIRYNIIPEIISKDDALRGYKLTNSLIGDHSIFSSLLNYMKSEASEIIERMFTDKTALNRVYESIKEVDVTKITQSADMLLSLLEYTRNFYKSLPRVTHKLTFMSNFDLTLLSEYLQNIEGVLRSCHDNHNLDIRLMCQCASSTYIVGYEIKQIGSNEDVLNILNEAEGVSSDGDLKNKVEEITRTLDSIGLEYGAIVGAIVNQVSKLISKNFISECHTYIKRVWTVNRNFEPGGKIDEVSPLMSEPLHILRSAISTCHDNLPEALYSRLVITLFKSLNDGLFHALCNRKCVEFDDYNAAQLKVDIEKGLESLRWLDDSHKHEQPKAVKKLYEACILLNLRNTLNTGSNTSLADGLCKSLGVNLDEQDVLQNIHRILHKYIECGTDVHLKILEQMGIYNLSKLEALNVLNLIAG